MELTQFTPAPRSNLADVERASQENPLYGVLPAPGSAKSKRGYTADEHGCWVWTGRMNGQGLYGSVSVRRDDAWITTPAHCWAYVLWVGPIPEGLTLDHLCSNTLCIRPDHLDVCTAAENIRRAWAKRTHCRNGHEYAAGGVLLLQRAGRESLSRYCRACRLANSARARATQRARLAGPGLAAA